MRPLVVGTERISKEGAPLTVELIKLSEEGEKMLIVRTPSERLAEKVAAEKVATEKVSRSTQPQPSVV